jgi:hypothetical protein
MAEAADLPETDLTVWSGASATGALAHAMDIAAAGVFCPDRGFAFERLPNATVMLLNPQIAYGVAGSPHGCQQLHAVVLQGLPPLGMTRSHREHAPLEAQWPAVRCQLISGDVRPVLPKPCQAAIATPLTAESV